MEAIREAIAYSLAADHPMSVRQLFYRLTTLGTIAKTVAEYKTVCRLTAEMRRSGEIPYEWLADATRWMRKPITYGSAEEALRRIASTYRQELWDEHDVQVEVWLEKDALAGVLVDVTDEWAVPLMVTRGYPSMSFLHSAAAAIHARAERGQFTQIYYFGDRDPSGVDIDRAVVQGIGEALESLAGCRTEGGPTAMFDRFAGFSRAAVRTEQIADWNLPSRPTKRSDTRSKRFDGESVELDAIAPDTLRSLVAFCIEHHVDQRQLKVLKVAEREERAVLERMAATMGGAS